MRSGERPLRGMHLGAEYNANRGGGEDMNVLMRRFLATPSPRHFDNAHYFARVRTQVECARRIWPGLGRDPMLGEFLFDDVSLHRRTGTQSPTVRYVVDVYATREVLRDRILAHRTDIVIVAGGDPFEAFRWVVVPLLEASGWEGHVVRMRNPSRRGHMGSVSRWDGLYSRFPTRRSSLPSAPAGGVEFWSLEGDASARSLRLVAVKEEV